jgi:hypothetical protein
MSCFGTFAVTANIASGATVPLAQMIEFAYYILRYLFQFSLLPFSDHRFSFIYVIPAFVCALLASGYFHFAEDKTQPHCSSTVNGIRQQANVR